MNRVYKVLIVINLLIGLFFLWHVFKAEPIKIAEINLSAANYDYCINTALGDSAKIAECEYEYDYIQCWIYGENPSELSECILKLEKPASLK